MKKPLSLLIGSLVLSTTLSVAHAAPFTAEQETRIQTLIRETLIQHPDILEDAANALQQKQITEQAAIQKVQIEANRTALYDDAASPRLGAKDAKLTLVYFTDYNCPYCKRFDPQVLGLLKKFPDLAIIIKVVPFLGASSKEAAEFASSVWLTQPDKFLSIHEDMMGHKTRHDDTSLKAILNKDGFSSLAISEEGKNVVQRNFELSQKMSIRGTPATIIGEHIIAGAVPINELETLIRQQLK